MKEVKRNRKIHTPKIYKNIINRKGSDTHQYIYIN